MKYSHDTFRFYKSERTFSYIIRGRVVMKDPVDIEALDAAVNTAITRYPYFAVCVGLDPDGGYVLSQNPQRIAVIRKGKRCPKLGSDVVNGHLLFVESEGSEIDFYISHALCGGRGFQPFVMTCIWQYVVNKYGVTPVAPAIRKPGSELLPGETDEPTLQLFPENEPIYRYHSKKPVVLIRDYLNGMFNPFRRKPNYRLYTLCQKDIISFVKQNDASVASFILVVMAKALDRVLPKEAAVIGGEIAHNPSASLGMPNTHCDLLSHVHIDYEREMLQWDMEKLGTMTRGQIILQTDPSVSFAEVRREFEMLDKLEQVRGLKNKKASVKQWDSSTSKSSHGTYIVNYTGWMDWGEVADYMASYALVVEGHVLLEVTSMGEKIFVTLMQLIDETKYAVAFQQVLTEIGIPYTVEGPFPKRLTKHALPSR